jgi:hypothetical protein
VLASPAYSWLPLLVAAAATIRLMAAFAKSWRRE